MLGPHSNTTCNQLKPLRRQENHVFHRRTGRTARPDDPLRIRRDAQGQALRSETSLSGQTRRSAALPRSPIMTALAVRQSKVHNSVAQIREKQAPFGLRDEPLKKPLTRNDSKRTKPGEQQPPPTGDAHSRSASTGGSKLPSISAPGRSKQSVTRIGYDEGETRESDTTYAFEYGTRRGYRFGREQAPTLTAPGRSQLADRSPRAMKTVLVRL